MSVSIEMSKPAAELLKEQIHRMNCTVEMVVEEYRRLTQPRTRWEKIRYTLAMLFWRPTMLLGTPIEIDLVGMWDGLHRSLKHDLPEVFDPPVEKKPTPIKREHWPERWGPYPDRDAEATVQ